MRIVKLKGGLGNQMFQYAFAKMIEQKTGDVVKLDFSAFASLKEDKIRVPRIVKFSLSLQSALEEDLTKYCLLSHGGNSQKFSYRFSVFLEKTMNRKYFWEPNRGYINPDELKKYTFYDGYWQSYRYVETVFEKLKKDFMPQNSISGKSAEMKKRIESQNAVFVGVRKGDYAKEAAHYGSFSEAYYITAMDKISKTIENPVFYIFSNDIEWCKKNIKWGTHQVIFREEEDQVDDFEELLLMASCKHAIIMNSSYHWWGAYLIVNQDKIVICPEKWFFDNKSIDIIPPEWIKHKDKCL